MVKPLKPKFPRWASENIVNPTNRENNVYEPSEQKKNLGWDLNEIPPRQYFNWLGRQTYESLNYLDYFLNRPDTFTSSTLPAVSADNIGKMIYINDISNGIIAYSNGTNWINITTGNPV